MGFGGFCCACDYAGFDDGSGFLFTVHMSKVAVWVYDISHTTLEFFDFYIGLASYQIRSLSRFFYALFPVPSPFSIIQQ